VIESAWPPWSQFDCDVVVLGASYGGLVVATLLAEAGKRTIIVDPAERVGVPGGTWPHKGYWLPWGHRDGPGMRQNSFTTYRWNFEAAERAGVELPVVGPHDPTMLVHLLPENEVLPLHVGGSTFERLAREVLLLDDESITELQHLLERLATTSRADAEALIPVRVGDWLRDNDVSKPASDGLLAYLTMIWSVPPEETSVGRLIINNLQTPFGLYSMNHPDYGGNQGVVELYAARFRELGGEIRFDEKPHEILMEDGRAVGVRTRTSTSFVREIRAAAVVFTPPAYMVFDLVDEARFPSDFVAKARSVKKYETPLLSLFLGLRDLPRRRRDGLPEDTVCFQRLLLGPERRLGGGWSVWSNGCRSLAPAGKHLLGIHLSDAFASFDDAKARFAELVDYVRTYYVDLEDVTEWHEYEWITETQSMPWTLKTDERAPMRTPIDGLYLAGFSTEVVGTDYDAEANSAIQVADMIIAGETS